MILALVSSIGIVPLNSKEFTLMSNAIKMPK
jgi:hypothetical protein